MNEHPIIAFLSARLDEEEGATRRRLARRWRVDCRQDWRRVGSCARLPGRSQVERASRR